MKRLLALGAAVLSALMVVAVAGGVVVMPALAQSYGGYGASGSSGAATASGGASGRFGAAAAPIQRVRLTVEDFEFYPAEISFPAGTQIAWVNRGQVRHTVTASGQWDSGPIAPGGRWAAVFWTPGTYDYVCTIHPDLMHGRITITAQ